MTRREQIEMLMDEREDCARDGSYTQEWLDALSAAIEALKKEPIKGHWISTAEDLPNIDEDVLVTDIHGNITVYTLKDDWEAVPLYWEDDAGYYVDFSDVVAWMPLPQPYKAESEE